MKIDKKWWALALLLFLPIAPLSAQEGVGDELRTESGLQG